MNALDESKPALAECPRGTGTPDDLTPYDAGSAYVIGRYLAALLLIVMGGLISQDLVSATAGKMVPLTLIALVIGDGTQLLISAFYAKRRDVAFVDAFGIRAVPARNLFYAICLGVVLVGLSVLTNLALEIISNGRITQAVLSDANRPTSGDSLILSVAGLLVITPIFEEVLFRGFMVRAFRRWGDGWAIFVPTLIFGLGHHPMSIPGALACGLAGASLAIQHGSIFPSVALHLSMNAIPLLIVSSHRSLAGRFGQDVASASALLILLCLLAVSVVAIYLCFRKELKSLLDHISCAWKALALQPDVGKRALALCRHWAYIVLILTFVVMRLLP